MPFGKGKNDMVSLGICWYNIRERLENGEVKVYVETPDERDGFHNMTCYLPSYRVEINGYSEKEVEYYMDVIKSTAHLIIEFAQEGGFMNASSF